MDDRLSGVAEFVNVVESGSFAAAAAQLGVTRSAVAKVIARLEQRLNTRLLQRTTRSLNLTGEGALYYEQCKRVLTELSETEAALLASRQEPTGRLRMTVPVLFGRHCVAPVMRRLIERHPQLEVEIAFSDGMADLVEDRFDIAVRMGPLPNHATLVSRQLGFNRMALCASPAYLDKHGRPTTLRDLDAHTCIVYARGAHHTPWRLPGPDGELQTYPPASRLRLDDLLSIADAAAAGTGLAWLPCWLISSYLNAGQLTVVMGHEGVLDTEINVLWLKTRHMPLKVRVAIDALVDEVPRILAQA
ncbi:LysR family transcriptional regulator [Ralstonia insidiosa]|uniref:LysR family transcriptional regulator n=1 Tax=Ralstonia insidiosa TaxID=190721 RepID=UPI000CEE4E19|nr:LysR family transcriptional regulator [Ralstonia insidiosa]